jgi:molecular chaperone GrpE
MSEAEETLRGEPLTEDVPSARGDGGPAAGETPAAPGQAPRDEDATPEPATAPGESPEDAAGGPAQPADAAGEAAEEPDYHDRWLRAAAELENVRKRARRDAGLAETRGVLRLARELLPSLDNLDRALAAAESQPENADHHLTDGIRLVQREMLAALERVGIVPDVPSGEQFDPHRHEAVAQQPADGVRSGTVIDVYQAGYRLGDDVVRAAKVVVAA